jgi:hypothetical protein
MAEFSGTYRLDCNETLELARAVERSQRHSEIVTIDWDSRSVELAVEELSVSHAAEDCVVNAGVAECWGADWRVHLRAVDELADW